MEAASAITRFVARFSALLAVLLLGAPVSAAEPQADPAQQFVWTASNHRVTADIRNWTLPDLMEKIAEATGWDIFLEPGLTHPVSVRFQNEPPGEALRLLLSPLNFAWVPEPNHRGRLLVFRTSATAATQRMAAAPADLSGTAGRIPNELLVTVKPGTDIDALARKLGATVVGRADEIHTYRLRFPDEASAQEARKLLVDNPAVDFVGDNFSVPRHPASTPVNLTGPGAPNIQFNPGQANGLMIGLIDTAIQPFSGDLAAFFLDAISVAGAASPPGTHPTHATAMALATLYAMGDASVPILPVDIFGPNATTTHYEVGLGVIRAMEAGANILILSLGSSTPSPFLESIVSRAHSHGALLVAAAGNTPVTAPTYPAAYPSVLAVTAGDRQGNVAQYANRGAFVDVIAPGSILVPYGGQTFHVTGTSVAGAYAAGVAARMAVNLGIPPQEAGNALRSQKP